jgi:hypothetical protein
MPSRLRRTTRLRPRCPPSGGATVTLFVNTLTLPGLLGRNAEVPPANGIKDDPYAEFTLCVESGVWWRPANEWISRAAWHRIVCPGPYFCGLTLGVTQGSHIEVEGYLTIVYYAGVSHENPACEINATQIRRLEMPSVGASEHYGGECRPLFLRRG